MSVLNTHMRERARINLKKVKLMPNAERVKNVLRERFIKQFLCTSLNWNTKKKLAFRKQHYIC